MRSLWGGAGGGEADAVTVGGWPVVAAIQCRPYHTYIVSRCFYRCKCLNSRTRRKQGGWHPHPNEQLSR